MPYLCTATTLCCDNRHDRRMAVEPDSKQRAMRQKRQDSGQTRRALMAGENGRYTREKQAGQGVAAICFARLLHTLVGCSNMLGHFGARRAYRGENGRRGIRAWFLRRFLARRAAQRVPIISGACAQPFHGLSYLLASPARAPLHPPQPSTPRTCRASKHACGWAEHSGSTCSAGVYWRALGWRVERTASSLYAGARAGDKCAQFVEHILVRLRRRLYRRGTMRTTRPTKLTRGRYTRTPAAKTPTTTLLTCTGQRCGSLTTVVIMGVYGSHQDMFSSLTPHLPACCATLLPYTLT